MSKETHSQIIPPVALVAAGVFLWSTGGLFIKVTTLNAVHVNFGRALFAATTVGIFILIRRQLVAPPRGDVIVVLS